MIEIFHCHYLPHSPPFNPHHSTVMYHLKDYEEIIVVATQRHILVPYELGYNGHFALLKT
jgi:hypothetical protein